MKPSHLDDPTTWRCDSDFDGDVKDEIFVFLLVLPLACVGLPHVISHENRVACHEKYYVKEHQKRQVKQS